MTAVLVLVSSLAWVVTWTETRGMGSGTVSWFLGLWVAMTVAMMLPAAMPAARAYRALRSRTETIVFLAAQLAVWTVVGSAAFALERNPLPTSALLVAAAVYQLAPPKHACLKRCRRPLHYVMRAPLRAGFAAGADCVGCCAGLMLALFALGMMSVTWMAIAAAAIAAEKIAVGGERLAYALGIALAALAAVEIAL